MTVNEIKQQITELKSKTDTAVIAHSYMAPEILEIADLKGDSFVLSVNAAKLKQKRVIMCGVKFMAETVKMLSPDKTVILAAPEATCPMADQISPERVRSFKKENPGYIVACYINTNAALKSECDVCVTSSSALKILEKIPQKNILFVPDANLGMYIQKMLPGKNILLWDGCCPIHSEITAEDVENAMRNHPDAKLLAHPECKAEVLDKAFLVGSTAAILDYASNNDGEFIIGTEKGVYDWLSMEYPNKRFHLLSKKLICPDMKITAMIDVLKALKGNGGLEIIMSETDISSAKKCIDKMIELGE